MRTHTRNPVNDPTRVSYFLEYDHSLVTPVTGWRPLIGMFPASHWTGGVSVWGAVMDFLWKSRADHKARRPHWPAHEFIIYCPCEHDSDIVLTSGHEYAGFRADDLATDWLVST
jgi:hypothetical protein